MMWLLFIPLALVALVVIAYIAGAMLPRDHVAGSSIVVRQPRDAVWRVVRDLAGTTGWWIEITTSQRAADAAGREIWDQKLKNGFTMRLIITEDVPPRRLVTTIDGPPNAPFGGTWTYELTDAPGGGGTKLTVTERGFISNPLFRFMSRFIFGYYGTQQGYLRALGKKLGEDVQPIRET